MSFADLVAVGNEIAALGAGCVLPVAGVLESGGRPYRRLPGVGGARYERMLRAIPAEW